METEKKPFYIKLAIVLILGILLGSALGSLITVSFLKPQQLASIPTNETKFEGYSEKIFEILKNSTGPSLSPEQIAQIQVILNLASHYQIPPWMWHSPPQTWIEPGSEVETASYIIFTDGQGNYYAKSGLNGSIMFSGTDASTVIQEVLDITAWQQTVVVKNEGTWTLTSPIKFPCSSLNGGDKTLIIEGPIKYTGTDAAIIIGQVGWSNIIFNRIFTPYGKAAYGIRILGGVYNKIIGNQIGGETDDEGSPSQASIFFDANESISDVVGNEFRINRLFGGGPNITVRTKYGIKLDSGGTHHFEGNRFYIPGSILLMSTAGLKIGSNATQHVNFNYFEVDIDALDGLSSPVTQVLIDVYNDINTILLTGWTRASGSYDVVFESSSHRCYLMSYDANELRVNDLGYMNSWSPAIREHEVLLAGRGVTVTGNAGTTYAILPGIYHWVKADWSKIHQVVFEVSWNPQTTSGGLQLYDATDNITLATFEPGTVGWRWDSADLTSYFRGFTSDKYLRIRTKGDGTTAPTIDAAYLKIVTLG